MRRTLFFIKQNFALIPDFELEFGISGNCQTGTSYSELRNVLIGSEINANLNRLERDILPKGCIPDLSWADGEEPLLQRCSRLQYEELEPVLILHFIRACRKRKASTGFGYPFDLPWVSYAEELFARAIEVHDCLALLRERRIKPTHLKNLADLLYPFLPDGDTSKIISPILHRCQIRERQLDELRRVMRLQSPKDCSAPLSASYGVNSRKEILTFNNSLADYRDRLRIKVSSKGEAFRKEGYEIILSHLEKYWGNLILHPTLWRALKCQIVDRTNNFSESGHRNSKQRLRKTSGRPRIHREYSDYGTPMPLISNLTNAKYVERVLGEYDNLPLVFAQLDPREVEYYRQRFQEAKHGALFQAVRTVSGRVIV